MTQDLIEHVCAWREIETLFRHQWDDGMVPHIILHEMNDGYFPAPDVWATGCPPPTSGITRPAEARFAVRRIHAQAKNRALADVQGTGLVAIIHPWESG